MIQIPLIGSLFLYLREKNPEYIMNAVKNEKQMHCNALQ